MGIGAKIVFPSASQRLVGFDCVSEYEAKGNSDGGSVSLYCDTCHSPLKADLYKAKFWLDLYNYPNLGS